MLNYGPNLGALIDAAFGEEHYDAQRRLLRVIDGLVQPTAKSFGQIAPSGTDADGDVHIVGTGAVGPWAGRDGCLARYYTVGIGAPNWDFLEPREGWSIRLESMDNSFGVSSLAVFKDGGWVLDSASPDNLDAVDLPLVGSDEVVIFRDGRMYRSPASSLGGEGVAIDASSFDSNVPYITYADVAGKIRLNLSESGLKVALALDNVNNTSDLSKPISTLQQAALDDKLDSSEVGFSVAPLVGGLVPSIHLPSYVDDVLEFADIAAFPVTGETGKLYIAINDGDSPSNPTRQYRWSGSVYTLIPSSPGSTDEVPEGTVNLYFTAARALETILTGFVAATSGFVVTAADSIRTALQKIQGRLNQLGTAANATLTTTSVDVTVGRVLKVGDLGIGAEGGVFAVTDFDAVSRNGYYQSNSTATVGSPVAELEVQMNHVATSSTDAVQFAASRLTGRTWDRVKDNGTWKPWTERYTTGNTSSLVQSFLGLANPNAERFIRFNTDNTASLLDAAAMRLALGVGTGSGSVTSVGMSVPTGLEVTGSPITNAGTFVITFASGYSLPSNASQATWNTAYSQTGQWNGGATGLNQANGRTSLGLVSVAWTGSAADLTTGTLADARLPTSLAGKTFTSMVTVNAATGQILDLRAATDANGYAIFRNAAGTAIGYLGTANGGAASGGAAADFAINSPGALHLVSGVGSITLTSASVTVTGAVAAASFSGSGAGLTSIPAANLTGTILDARLPATMSGKTFTGNIVVQKPAPIMTLYDTGNPVATLNSYYEMRDNANNVRGQIGFLGSSLLQVSSSAGAISLNADGALFNFSAAGLATLPGSLTILGSSSKITSDFSSAATRTLLQTSTLNGATRVEAVPNGTGTTANLGVWNNSNNTNATAARLTATASDVRVECIINGTGGYLPLSIYNNGTAKITVPATGNITFSTGLAVTGALSATGGITNGSGTGQVINVINGGSGVTAGGAATYFNNAGVTNAAIGGYSAIIGGSYDPELTLYSINSVSFVNSGGARTFIATSAGNISWPGVATGNGSGLTNLNASSISAGTLAAARLPFSYSTTNTPNYLVQRDSNGYIFANYVRTEISQTTGAISDVYVGIGNDNFIYKMSPANALAAMGGVASSSLAAIATSGSATDLVAGTINDARIPTTLSSKAITGTLSCTGAFTCQTWTATSDKRLKENIKELSVAECKEILANVNWCSFDIIDGQKNLNGVIAQELIAIYPDAVVQDKDGKYSVNYSLLYNLQMRVNQDLEQRLSRLEKILGGVN